MTKLEKLIEGLALGSIFCSIKKRPGAVIESLKPEDRELLKKATSKDFYHRLPWNK